MKYATDNQLEVQHNVTIRTLNLYWIRPVESGIIATIVLEIGRFTSPT